MFILNTRTNQPTATPRSVSESLQSLSSAFWCSGCTSASRLQPCIELLSCDWLISSKFCLLWDVTITGTGNWTLVSGRHRNLQHNTTHPILPIPKVALILKRQRIMYILDAADGNLRVHCMEDYAPGEVTKVPFLNEQQKVCELTRYFCKVLQLWRLSLGCWLLLFVWRTRLVQSEAASLMPKSLWRERQCGQLSFYMLHYYNCFLHPIREGG